MTVSANSYGSASGIAGYVRSMTGNASTPGTFDANTVPTLANVESWIDQFSEYVNSVLEGFRFTTPVTSARAVILLAGYVEAACAEMVHYSRGMGRFVQAQANGPGRSPASALRKEIYESITQIVQGLENMGVTRNSDETGNNEVQAGVLTLNFVAHGDDPDMVVV